MTPDDLRQLGQQITGRERGWQPALAEMLNTDLGTVYTHRHVSRWASTTAAPSARKVPGIVRRWIERKKEAAMREQRFTEAVSHIQAAIAAGRRPHVHITGPSGSGKSTLAAVVMKRIGPPAHLTVSAAHVSESLLAVHLKQGIPVIVDDVQADTTFEQVRKTGAALVITVGETPAPDEETYTLATTADGKTGPSPAELLRSAARLALTTEYGLDRNKYMAIDGLARFPVGSLPSGDRLLQEAVRQWAREARRGDVEAAEEHRARIASIMEGVDAP